MNIIGVLSTKTFAKFSLWLQAKNKTADNHTALEVLEKHFNSLHNGRLNNSELFYADFPSEFEEIAETNEKLYEKLLAMFDRAYEQGYQNGVQDLDRLHNLIDGNE